MLILGIETSGWTASIALECDGRSVAAREIPRAGRRHAQTLVTEIVDLFHQSGHTARECDAVAVSIGPGSFTGLRVGVVCAKTFAYATGGRLLAVDTFQSIAINAMEANTTEYVPEVLVIDDAQRGDLFVGRYHPDDAGRMVPSSEVAIVDAQRWCAERTEDDVVSGPGCSKFEAQLVDRCRLVAPELRASRAVAVAQLGSWKAELRQFAAPFALEPFYLRRSAAEEKWDAERKPSTEG